MRHFSNTLFNVVNYGLRRKYVNNFESKGSFTNIMIFSLVLLVEYKCSSVNIYKNMEIKIIKYKHTNAMEQKKYNVLA